MMSSGSSKNENEDVISNKKSHKEDENEDSKKVLQNSKSDVNGSCGESVILIVGDCVIPEDDKLWQLEEFSNLTQDPANEFDLHSGSFSIPWFDPPLISPQPSVRAVPVSPRTLDYAFGIVFGDEIGSGSEIMKKENSDDDAERESDRDRGVGNVAGNCTNDVSYLRSATPLSGSSFSVLVYSNKNSLRLPQKLNEEFEGIANPAIPVPGLGTFCCPLFGPHDFCTLREFLLCDCRRPKEKEEKEKQREIGSICGSVKEGVIRIKSQQYINEDSTKREDDASGESRISKTKIPKIIAETVTLDFLWTFLLEIGCVDSLLFLELRWIILRKIKEHLSVAFTFHSNEISAVSPCSGDAAVVMVGKWCDAALECVRQHASSSLLSAVQMRTHVSQWLLALSSFLSMICSHEDISVASPRVENVQKICMHILRCCCVLHSEDMLRDGLGMESLDADLAPHLTPCRIFIPCSLTEACVSGGDKAVSATVMRVVPGYVEVIEEATVPQCLYFLTEREATYSAYVLLAVIGVLGRPVNATRFTDDIRSNVVLPLLRYSIAIPMPPSADVVRVSTRKRMITKLIRTLYEVQKAKEIHQGGIICA